MNSCGSYFLIFSPLLSDIVDFVYIFLFRYFLCNKKYVTEINKNTTDKKSDKKIAEEKNIYEINDI